MTATPRPPAQRVAAAWCLGVLAAALVLLALLRGAGRIVLPLLAVVALGLLLRRAWRALRAPLP